MSGEDVQRSRLGLSYALLYAVRCLGLQAEAYWELSSTPKHFQKVLKTSVLVANFIFYFLKKPKAEFLIHVTESSLDFGPVESSSKKHM